ncbi:MAG: PH domain-containing protein [Chloroflexi bacterium]|nr:PH domain-containing protein [Chloroflexota bacterium]
MATEPGRAGQRKGKVNLPFPLQGNEDVLVICRRHWMYLWPRTIFWTVLAILPVAVVAWLLFGVGDVGGQAAMIFWLVALVYVLAWAVRIFLNWYQYDNDLWVVTNQRVVDCIKPNPFGLKISTADLVNIQDMTVVRSGLLQTALNYGDIVCQTAADNRDFTLGGIPRPQDVQLLMDKERDRERLRGR